VSVKTSVICKSRWDFIRPHVGGLKVLDVGPAELVGTVNRDKMDRWLHQKMVREALSVVGVEQSPTQVEALAALGFDIRQGDAESFELGESFDVVVAGELIEHLSRPADFLDQVRRHLRPGGKLLLTTPNRFGILAIYRVLRSGKIPVYGKDLAKHVAYYDSDALGSMLARHGFPKIEIGYCHWVGPPSRRWFSRLLVRVAAAIRPVMLPTLLVVAQVAPTKESEATENQPAE
jgi:SAM-dependent methyltransferase